MIGTAIKGLKIIEEGTEVYSGKLPVEGGYLLDTIYIPNENCYLLRHNNQLFRKDIDENPAYLFMDVICGARAGACFKYSIVQKRLIINKDMRNISVVNLQTKTVEIEVEKTVGDILSDIKVFGPQDTRVASASDDGYLLLYKLNYSQRQGSIVGSYKIDLMEERREVVRSLGVCSKHQHVLVEIGLKVSPWVSSRMLLFRMNNNQFTLKAFIDSLSQNIGRKYPLECYGYAGRNILWMGLSTDKNGVVQIYSYDIEREELKELEEKRISHQEDHPVKVHRVGDGFYYTGYVGKAMEVKISFNSDCCILI